MAKDQKDTAKNEDTSWRDDVSGVSTPAEKSVISFPSMIYLPARPDMRGTFRESGGFFIADESEAKVSEIFGQRVTFVSRDNEDVDGWFAKTVRCTVICARRAWFVRESAKHVTRFPWDSYRQAERYGKPRSKAQIVMQVNGVADYVTLTLTGLQCEFCFGRDGWAQRARTVLYAPVQKMLNHPDRLPSLQFYITLGTAVDRDNKPVMLTVGQGDNTSTISRIALVAPQEAPQTDGQVKSLVVPKKVREGHETLWRELSDWREAWSRSDAQNSGYAPSDDAPHPADGYDD